MVSTREVSCKTTGESGNPRVADAAPPVRSVVQTCMLEPTTASGNPVSSRHASAVRRALSRSAGCGTYVVSSRGCSLGCLFLQDCSVVHTAIAGPPHGAGWVRPWVNVPTRFSYVYSVFSARRRGRTGRPLQSLSCRPGRPLHPGIPFRRLDPPHPKHSTSIQRDELREQKNRGQVGGDVISRRPMCLEDTGRRRPEARAFSRCGPPPGRTF